MDLKGKNVLVTGATGFIGAHLVEALLKEGARVYCTLRALSPKSYFYKKALNKKSSLIKCDLANPADTNSLIRKNNYRFVFHLAGNLRPKNLQDAFLGNVGPTVNLLEAAKKSKSIKGLLFASSSRSKTNDLAGENLGKLLLRPYDLSKTISDLVVQSYKKNSKLPIVTIKYANVFGPGDDLVKPLRLTSDIMRSLKHHEVFVPHGSGQDKIDLIYVENVADAFINVAKKIDRYKYQTIGLKPLARYSVLDWAKKIARIVKQARPSSALEKAVVETYNWYK